MAARDDGGGYGGVFAVGLLLVTLGTAWAFWRVTGDDVRRSAEVAAARRAPAPAPSPEPAPADDPAVPLALDTLAPWAPSPLQLLADSVYVARQEGRLADALALLEGWLARQPRDRVRRLAAARLAFELGETERGVGHYRRYLAGGTDRAVMREAVGRVLTELPADEARVALAWLLDVDDDFIVRVALARLTALAGDPRGADSLLAPLPPRLDPDVDALRRTVRTAMVPTVPEALRWVEEYPDEAAYQLALARALFARGRAAEALAPYRQATARDTALALREEMADAAVTADSLALASALLDGVLAAQPGRARARLAWARVRARLGDDAGAVAAFEALLAERPDDALVTEAQGALADVRDPALALPLRRRLLVWRPSDVALRRRLAQDLEALGDVRGAEAQYDTLLTQGPDGGAFLARARLRAGRDDLDGALADLAAADAQSASLEAALLEGDIHRWREARGPAGRAYARAARLAPGDPRVAEGLARLAAQRRAALAYEAAWGSVLTSGGLADSDGYEGFGLRAQQGVAPLGDETIVTGAGELRRVAGPGLVAVAAYGGDVGVARRLGAWQVGVRAGALAFDGGVTTAVAGVEATRRWTGVTARGAVTYQPAYETLRSALVVRPDSVLSGTTLLGSVSAGLGPRLELYAQADHLRLEDGNRRSVLAASLRWPVIGPVGVLYAGGAATFDRGTVAYWSPATFVTQGVGVDVRTRRSRGWSWGARLTPAVAWIRETAPGRPAGTVTALQVNATADLLWRSEAWEVGVFGGYGQDRAGTYSAGLGGLRVRAAW